MKRVDHLWIQLLLVQKYQIQKYQQWTLHHVKENREKSTYQRTRIQTQTCHTFCGGDNLATYIEESVSSGELKDVELSFYG